MSVKAIELGLICGCCACIIANDDDSGCVYTCGPEHSENIRASIGAICRDEGGNIVPSSDDENSPHMARCAICGDDAMCDVTAAVLVDTCTDASGHLPGADHRWQECPTYTET